MRTRLAVLAAGLVVTATCYYVASPLIAADTLRHAVHTGDAPTVESMIDWPSLRASIRDTVTRNARLLPVVEATARREPATWWQRIRSTFGHTMLDRFVERYITPKGLTELYRARDTWHQRIKPKAAALAGGAAAASVPTPVTPTPVTPSNAPAAEPFAVATASIVPPRIAAAWRRIKRAEFESPFRFVLEIEDRHTAARRIESTFQLTSIGWRGPDWKLVAVSVRTVNPTRARLNGF